MEYKEEPTVHTNETKMKEFQKYDDSAKIREKVRGKRFSQSERRRRKDLVDVVTIRFETSLMRNECH
jgi:hypothetical protein